MDCVDLLYVDRLYSKMTKGVGMYWITYRVIMSLDLLFITNFMPVSVNVSDIMYNLLYVDRLCSKMT